LGPSFAEYALLRPSNHAPAIDDAVFISVKYAVVLKVLDSPPYKVLGKS
jgi:hypothetical protein